MTDDQLRSMTEEEIRDRFRCAPAYYLNAKLERRRALTSRDTRPAENETAPEEAAADPAPAAEPRDEAPAEAVSAPATPSPAAAPEPAPVPDLPPASEPAEEPVLLFDREPLQAADYLEATRPASAPAEAPGLAYDREPGLAPESLDLALPGFEILEAALSDFEHFDPTVPPAEDPLTQHEILEAALEDYGNWPFLSEPEPRDEPADTASDEHWITDSGSDLDFAVEPASQGDAGGDPRLEQLLQRVLDAEPELDLVLGADPGLERAFAAGALETPDNVTHGDFGAAKPGRVRVVMDRKRPNMVRVLGETTRLAG